MSLNALKFNIDWFNNRMLVSTNSQTTFTPRPFTQDNILPVEVKIVEPSPDSAGNSFIFPDISNVSLQAVITALPVGNVADSPFMTQYAFTKDITNTKFSANFDLTATAVTTFLAAAASKQAWLEFVAIEGVAKSTIWAGQVTLNATAIKNAGAAAVVGNPLALTLQDALQRFPQFKLGAGQVITFESPTTGRERIIGVNEDGTAQDDLL